MNFSVSLVAPLELQTPCLVLPVWSEDALPAAATAYDEKLGGLLAEIVASDGFSAGVGETRVVYASGENAPRLVLLGLGKRDNFSLDRFRKALVKAARAVRAIKKSSFALALPSVDTAGLEPLVQSAAEAIELGLMQFNDFKRGEHFEIEAVTLLLDASADADAAQTAIERAGVLCRANARARALVNQPSNIKTPASIAAAAVEVATETGLRIEVWDEQKIQDEKMGALWGVGMGSDHPPRFIVMEYMPPGTENDAPVALVGKGMSFDTGGYSIKTSGGMEEMKDDMAGAAVVIAAMSALKDLNVKKRVLGVVASAENMISGNAQRPGDIVTARDGTTIEVLNTDAEGRLILADALTWTSEQKPELIVDFATLTGAIGVALGQEGAGLFSNDDGLSRNLEEAGLETGEKLWRFPLWEEYDDYMKGSASDLKNISAADRRAGSIAAAIFLRHFVPKNTPWAHLDIAAVSHVRDSRLLTERGATGFGVRLILDFLST
ncbi:cytosol aminopeptidase [Abditibacteriota bacterium]|nr:cytosol aminopeptidase [Abditibacteriota bacterium]